MNRIDFFDSNEMFGWIEQMFNMGPRRPGSFVGHKNEDFLLRQLQILGVKTVHKEPLNIQYWEAHRAILELDGGDGFKPVNAQEIPYVAFTPEQGIEAPLAYADPKKIIQGGDWRGKIVVTDISFPLLDAQLLQKFSLGVFDPQNTLQNASHPATWIRINWHFYRKAFKQGAVGFIGILKDQPGGSYRMYAPYGFKEKNIMDKPLPGFWVGRNEGERLRNLAKKGTAHARMTLVGEKKPGVTHNIVGEIPGESDEIIVLSCHHDSPFSSAVEDASGCSVVLALAKHFASQQNLKRKLVILFSAGHFYGSIGTRSFINSHREDIVKKVALEISIEHIAKEAIEDKNGRLIFSGQPEATGIFVPFNKVMVNAVLKNIERNSVDRIILLPPEGPLGEYPPTDGGDWYQAGIPVINYICNPVYLLNAEDSLDRVMRDRLSKVAGAFADIIREVDGMSRETIASVEFRCFKRKMMLLRKIVKAKTTRFGTRKLY